MVKQTFYAKCGSIVCLEHVTAVSHSQYFEAGFDIDVWINTPGKECVSFCGDEARAFLEAFKAYRDRIDAFHQAAQEIVDRVEGAQGGEPNA